MSEANNPIDEQAMIEVWDRHTAAEFELKDADAAIATMTEHPVLTHVPVGTGASGKEALRKFYAEVFIPNTPEDFETELLSRTVGKNRIVDEFIMRCTHDRHMIWFAPGIEATGRKLDVPTIGIIQFEGEKIASEHIYWDPRDGVGATGCAGGGPVSNFGERAVAATVGHQRPCQSIDRAFGVIAVRIVTRGTEMRKRIQ